MRRREKLLWALVLSLFLHLAFLGAGVYFSYLNPPQATSPEREVEVTVIPPGYQIADITPPKKEETPEKSRFLGMYDSRVPDEKVAPSRSPAGGQKAAVVSKQENKEKKEQVKRAEGEGPKLATKPPEKAETKSRVEGDDFFEGLPEDFFPDYKLADHTYLNVLKFPKVGYFVRLKKIFRTTFNPVPSIRSSLFANQVSQGQIEVVLGVTVDRMGKLADLFVIRSSGLPRYDQEAVRTIRDSAPFAVPPQDLLNSPGALRMAWTFTVYL